MEINERLSLWERLQAAEKPIVLYGMGNGADKILDFCADKKIPVTGVFASDGFCRKHSFRGYPVMPYTQARDTFGDMIVLVAFGTARPEVIRNIERIAGEQELYAPDVPLMGGELFDMDYFRTNRGRLEEAYGFLEDDLSRKTFLSHVNFKISGNLSYLKECETAAQEAFRELPAFSDHEVYIDGGAYTGDTILEFARSVQGYERIIAVEPDNKNYHKLELNTEGMDNVECLNIGLYSGRGEALFAARAGRNSSFGEGGDRTAAVDSIDNILGGKKATFIKLDVEGQETEALIGAEKTIAAYKPRILAAAYHRSADLYGIPLLVKKIRPDYRVYMRHYPCIPAWDTYYCFV